MRKIKVQLLTTLKGRQLFSNGAVFTGTIAELPPDIADAVRKNARYIKVTELPMDLVEEVEENLIPEVVVAEIKEPAITVDSPVEESIPVQDEGQTTPEEKKPVTEEKQQPVKVPVKRTRKAKILKPKE